MNYADIKWHLESIEQQLALLQKTLNKVLGLDRRIERKETQLMKTLADLQADVAALADVDASAIALIQGLADQIRNLPPNDAAAIDALATQVEEQKAALAAAITANTPTA